MKVNLRSTSMRSAAFFVVIIVIGVLVDDGEAGIRLFEYLMQFKKIEGMSEEAYQELKLRKLAFTTIEGLESLHPGMFLKRHKMYTGLMEEFELKKEERTILGKWHPFDGNILEKMEHQGWVKKTIREEVHGDNFLPHTTNPKTNEIAARQRWVYVKGKGEFEYSWKRKSFFEREQNMKSSSKSSHESKTSVNSDEKEWTESSDESDYDYGFDSDDFGDDDVFEEDVKKVPSSSYDKGSYASSNKILNSYEKFQEELIESNKLPTSKSSIFPENPPHENEDSFLLRFQGNSPKNGWIWMYPEGVEV